MDFVVVGIFIGAMVVGAGAVVRDIAPNRAPRIVRPDSESLSPDARIKAWRRFCQSAGMVMLTMGMIIVLATVVGVVLSLSDRTGWILVGGSTALAAIVIGVSAIVIPNHYRRGGFDPVVRTRPAVAPKFRPPKIERDVEFPLPAGLLRRTDDPFAIEPEPASLHPVDNARQADSPGLVVSEEGVASFSADASESAEIQPTVPARKIERPSPAPPVEPEQPAAPDRSPPEFGLELGRSREERLEAEPDLFPVSQPAESAPIEPLTVPTLDAPLIDPEDELPAWDAPTPPLREPTRYVPSAAQPARAGQPAADFESSLFADLDTPAEADGQITGPFQSRLLNELTSNPAEPAEPVTDVLLDEFSLPARDRTGARDADDSR